MLYVQAWVTVKRHRTPQKLQPIKFHNFSKQAFLPSAHTHIYTQHKNETKLYWYGC